MSLRAEDFEGEVQCQCCGHPATAVALYFGRKSQRSIRASYRCDDYIHSAPWLLQFHSGRYSRTPETIGIVASLDLEQEAREWLIYMRKLLKLRDSYKARKAGAA